VLLPDEQQDVAIAGCGDDEPREAFVSRRTLGILATVVGSAFGAWWLTSQRRTRPAGNLRPARDHGTVIFDNTPVASGTEGIL
jgi:hypothetical protein